MTSIRPRNRSRAAPDRVPDVAVFVTSKRLQPPTAAEGFDAVYRVHAEAGDFVVAPGEGVDAPPRTR